MKYINFFVAVATTIVLASCGSSENETQATPPVTTDGNVQPTTTNATTTTTPSTMPNPTAPTVATTPGANNSPAITTASSAINPEHGKPGHRCDIAVGAPLNSKPIAPAAVTPATTTTTSTPVNISQPVVTQSAPATNNAKTAAGINPEHGKPGHRCDIAVGAPLDSKPIQAAIQQPTTTTSTPAPKAALPYTPVNTQPTAAVAKGMNPAHGQPGHRCDIAVGAPLDSKPAQPAVVTQPAATNAAKTEAKPTEATKQKN